MITLMILLSALHNPPEKIKIILECDRVLAVVVIYRYTRETYYNQLRLEAKQFIDLHALKPAGHKTSKVRVISAGRCR